MHDWFSCAGISEEDGQIEGANEIIKTAIRVICQSKEEEEEWLEEVNWNGATNEDGFLASLLPTLINVEMLNLNLDKQIDYVQRVIERAAQKEAPFDTRPAFEKLTHILTTVDCDQWGMEPSFLALPLQLPAIKAVFGDRISSEDFDEEWCLRDIPTASSTVQHIELWESRLSSVDPANLLRVPITLKTSIYDLIGGANMTDCRVGVKAMHKALEAQKDSLQNIWLD